jgi:hypothetical protein
LSLEIRMKIDIRLINQEYRIVLGLNDMS